MEPAAAWGPDGACCCCCLGERWEGGKCWVNCVPAHATLVINAYPQSSALGSVWGFGLAPPLPSRVKVLHAGLAVIARRAYGWTHDVVKEEVEEEEDDLEEDVGTAGVRLGHWG